MKSDGQPCDTTASVIAGLTGIPTEEIPPISGNLATFVGNAGFEDNAELGQWSGSIGVG
jgi:hypothetical protein